MNPNLEKVLRQSQEAEITFDEVAQAIQSDLVEELKSSQLEIESYKAKSRH